MSDKNTEGSNSTGNDSDQDFDPTADMLVNDFDDEHTLEEEEALEEENRDELDDLQREGEMPLEELLALYGNLPNNVTTNEDDDDNDDDENEEQAEQVAVESSDAKVNENAEASQADNYKNWSHLSSKYMNKTIEPVQVSSNLSRLISTIEDGVFEISEDEDDDEDDTPENWRRTIQIGLDYQAAIPDSTLSAIDDKQKDSSNNYDDSKGLLLWNPKELSESEVTKFLSCYLNEHRNAKTSQETQSQKTSKVSTDAISVSDTTHINKISSSTSQTNSDERLKHKQQRDSEQALYLLLKNNYKISYVLTATKNDIDYEHANDLFTFIKPWTDDDCNLFEDGLRIYGKDFHQIHKNNLPGKTVNELVNFYYLWKKTERHDTFTTKFKFEKRKYSLNPTTTDLMDHFLDDNQPAQQTSFNSTSSSLNSSHNTTLSHHTRRQCTLSSPLSLLPNSNHQSNHQTNHLTNTATTTSSSSSSNTPFINLTTTDFDAKIDDKTSIKPIASTDTVPSTENSTSTNAIETTSANDDHIESTSFEENSNPSSDGRESSKLIINETINTFEDESNEFVSSSSTKGSSIKT